MRVLLVNTNRMRPAIAPIGLDYLSLHELVGGDKRFFLPSNEQVESNYNYNDNTVITDAVAQGARGAYWDILRRLQS